MGCRAAGLLLSRRVAPSLLHMLVRQRHNKRKKAVPTSANMKMFKDQTQTSPEAARYRLNAPCVFTLEREQRRSSFIHPRRAKRCGRRVRKGEQERIGTAFSLKIETSLPSLTADCRALPSAVWYYY